MVRLNTPSSPGMAKPLLGEGGGQENACQGFCMCPFYCIFSRIVIINKSSKFKIGNNILSNRLSVLNNNDLNRSLNSFETKCKQILLNYSHKILTAAIQSEISAIQSLKCTTFTMRLLNIKNYPIFMLFYQNAIC